MTYCIVNLPFGDWIPHLLNFDIQPFEIPGRKIIPLGYSDNPNSLFKNSKKTIDILNNKILFAKFMMLNFVKNIPKCMYYNFEDIFISEETVPKMIQKPAFGHSSIGIKIVSEIEPLENIVVSEYIDHEKYYAGHHLVKNGKIIKQIFFERTTDCENFIERSCLRNFNVVDINDSIFEEIFTSLNYSGFACSNFIIHEEKILFFEINPRLGGSLVHNEKYFSEFVDILNGFI